MKKILLSASLLLASVMTFAQVPDASQWTEGQEITDKIGWGNLSFEEPYEEAEGQVIIPFDSWKLESSKGDFTKTGGLFEVYAGADVDLYQYVQLPAGMYRVECQGYYRIGTSWDADPKAFGTSDWVDEAQLYVQNGAYDIESEAFTANRTFKCPLMPRLFQNYQEQLYVMPDGAAGWDMSDANYGEGKGWGPTSVPGSLVWFNEGLYAPYVADEENDEGKIIKYNTTSFWLTEDGYVKIGVSKIDPRSADSFMVTNFKMYYDGPVDAETVELLALQAEVQEYYNKLKKINDKYSEGMIYSLINDAISEFDDDFGNPDELEAEQCAPAKAYLENLINQIEATEAAYAKLQKLLPTAENLYNSTEYAGKADYQAAIQAAENCFDPDYEMGEEDGFDSFQKAYDNLVAARLTYLLTQEKVNGAYDFSSAINFPFFCNNEYTPTWNEAEGCFKYIDEIENTWVVGYGEKSVKEVMQEHPDWIDVCSDVTWTQKSGVTGEWIFNHNITSGWMGGIDNVTMQHGYTGVGAWSGSPTGGYQEMRQTITGLPAGYYAMGALFINAGNEPSEYNQYVYINAGSEPNDETMEKAQFTHKGEHWWWGTDNVHLWRTDDWQQLRTNMIQVGEDGVVTIGSRSNGFYNVTGFQLFYYGETPDFAALVQPALDAANANIVANLAWGGDIAKANAILASVKPAEITDGEGYQAALAAIAEANAYVTTASTVIKNWKGLENFQALMEKQEVGSPEEMLVSMAWTETLGIGEGEEDTYELAIQNDKDYAAYVHYLDYRASMGELINDAGVAAVVTTQNNYLAENFASDAELAEYEKALALPYNKALLASLGTDQASLTNPVDVTALIINPKFDEGQKGWTGDPTVTGAAIDEELGAAEMYNTDFDVYQILYSLPAGCYKVECQAFYRDGGDAKAAFQHWNYDMDDEAMIPAFDGVEYWANQNAFLYANDYETVVRSIAEEMPTERSMTAFCDKWVKSEESNGDGSDRYVKHYQAFSEDAVELPTRADFDSDAAYELFQREQLTVKNDDWWWDTEITDAGDVFYYPASLMGASKYLAKHPTAYKTTVTTMVEEGGNLQIGIKKDKEHTIGNDWVVCDNFKLYYLGTETPDGINDAAAEKAAVAGIFSVNGVQQKTLQQGINLVKSTDGQVKKVYKK